MLLNALLDQLLGGHQGVLFLHAEGLGAVIQ